MIASTALGRVSADLASRVASPVMQFGRGAQHFMKCAAVAVQHDGGAGEGDGIPWSHIGYLTMSFLSKN